MIFIYLFEKDDRYIHTIKPLFHQIETHKISGVTSTVSVIETLSPPKYQKDAHLNSEISRFFQETPGLMVYPVSWEISLEAARLRRTYPRLRTPDAIQLATAIITKADIFFTNDAKIKTLSIPDIKISFPGP